MKNFQGRLLIGSAILLCLSLAACCSVSVIHPLPASGITVEGNKILHEEKPYAELRYYFSARSSENPGEAYLFASSTQHRGIAMYYFGEQKLVWIFPKRGLEEDIMRGHFIAHGDGEGKLGWIFAVSVSPDGKTVHYKKPGLFYASAYEYAVETEVSR